jgi:hypothetical protein
MNYRELIIPIRWNWRRSLNTNFHSEHFKIPVVPKIEFVP